MSEKVLSQDEVDALLKGVASGDIDTDEARDKIIGAVRPYDFANQEQVIRGRMPGLEVANESFTRRFRNSISGLIMKFIDVSVQNVEIIKFGDFIKTIPVPSSINIFKMNPLKGYALLVVEAPLVFAFIEFFFGGTNAKNVKSEVRAFTPIEQRVVQKVVNMALQDMASAWSGIAEISPQFAGSEVNPQFVSIVNPSEIVINVEFLIEIEEFSGKLFFCVPYSLVEPVKDRLYSGIHGDIFEKDQRWATAIEKALGDTVVKMRAEIGSMNVTVEDVMNFEVGTILNLNKSIRDELLIKVEDVPKFRGTPGISRGNQAIKLTGTI